MSTLKALRAKIEAALKAASPDPWTIFATRGGHYGVKDARGCMVVYAEAGLDGYGNGSSKGDAEFIALARNATPQLLGEIDRLCAENERLRTAPCSVLAKVSNARIIAALHQDPDLRREVLETVLPSEGEMAEMIGRAMYGPVSDDGALVAMSRSLRRAMGVSN